MEKSPRVPLTTEQLRQYEERGHCSPIPVLTNTEAAEFTDRFMEYIAYNKERLEPLPPRDRYKVMAETHTFLNWAYRIVSHPRVLDAVESLLGPNLLVWSTRWFSKMPGENAYVSWHQDAGYWGLRPPKVTSAWVALSQSVPENGCMRVVPGTHKWPLLPQKDTFSPDNALSRGQEIAVEVDEGQAVDIILQPGQMSLHHFAIVHGSNPNTSDQPRIGLAIRYISPEVEQEGSARQVAFLVRGRDEYGHFDIMDSPKDDAALTNPSIQEEVLRRFYTNVMEKTSSGG